MKQSDFSNPMFDLLADYLSSKECAVLTNHKIKTVADLMSWMIHHTAKEVEAFIDIKADLIATLVMFMKTIEKPYDKSFDQWFKDFRAVLNGKKWYRMKRSRFIYLQEQISLMKEEAELGVEHSDSDSLTAIDDLVSVEEDVQFAEDFMMAFYETKVPYNPVKAALKMKMFSVKWANDHPSEAKRKASDTLTRCRDILDKNGLADIVKARVGMDIETARDTMLQVMLDGLRATKTVWVKDSRGKQIQTEIPDHDTRASMVKNFAKEFGLKKKDLLGAMGGAPSMPQTKEEAESDLVAMVVRNIVAFNISEENLFFQIREKLKKASR